MYEDDDDESNQYQQDEGPAALRAANKAQAKQIKALTEQLDAASKTVTDLTVKVNGTTVAGLLKAKGIDPGVSKFLTDVEPTEESINTWLAENGKFIGYDPNKGSDADNGEQPAAGTGTEVSPEMAQLRAAMAEVQRREANSAPGIQPGTAGTDGLARLNQNAKSFEDAEKGLRELGIIK